jgi:hypothetical protein
MATKRKRGSAVEAVTPDLLARWEAGEAAQLMAPYPDPLPAAAIAASAPTITQYGSSRFSEYRRCQRAHSLRYSEGIVRLRLGPSDTLDYFALGILIHAALAYFWEGLKLGEQRSWRDVLHAATQRPEGLERDLYHEAERLLAAYFAHHQADPPFGSDWGGGVEIVDVERELVDGIACPDCDNMRGEWSECGTCRGDGFTEFGSFRLPYTARLDLVVRIEGTLYVVDTKTRAKGLPENRAVYARKLRTRAQFLGQAHLAMLAYGLTEPPHVMVNAIVKTKIPQLGRLAVPISLEDVERWREQQRRDAAAGLAGDNMNYSSCAPEMGSPCIYLDYCHGSAEVRAKHYGKRQDAAAAADDSDASGVEFAA